MINKKHVADKEFQKLAAKINIKLSKNKGLYDDQKAHVEKLFSIERKFKALIKKYPKTRDIYCLFIDKIVGENGNILSARPFFREKSSIFNKEISKCIEQKNIEKLMTYNINYNFIKFIVDNWEGKLPTAISNTYQEFVFVREILIENNIPLAINRAKIFYRKVARNHLSLLDLVNICVQGLTSGVDKYAGEYRSVWRSVCIGRMTGYMIEECSKTFLKMYPSDRKILYRANAIKYRRGIHDISELTKQVNISFELDATEGKSIPKLPISELEIRNLLNGSSYVSAESPSEHDIEGVSPDTNIYDITESSEDMEGDVLYRDAMNKVGNASRDLEIIERKIIKMKGVGL